MREQSNGHHPDLHAALQHLLASGGKRVRPAVTMLAGGLVGADVERSITLAAAVELLHTATLVHDDMIDGSLLRRGNPTLNAQWSPAATILTGDFIFAQAAKLAAETDSIETMKLFAGTLSVLVSGELTQMFRSRGLVSRQDYFERIYAKTASMFELAAAAPVYLRKSWDADMFEAMREYGYQIGMAFQIVDDILDFVGDAENVGKPVASDLRQGLITLPALCYLENHPNDPDFAQMMEGEHHRETAMLRLVESVRTSGAVQQAMDEARVFVERGLVALEKMPPGPEHAALEELARYVIDRDI